MRNESPARVMLWGSAKRLTDETVAHPSNMLLPTDTPFLIDNDSMDEPLNARSAIEVMTESEPTSTSLRSTLATPSRTVSSPFFITRQPSTIENLSFVPSIVSVCLPSRSLLTAFVADVITRLLSSTMISDALEIVPLTSEADVDVENVMLYSPAGNVVVPLMGTATLSSSKQLERSKLCAEVTPELALSSSVLS